MKGLRLLMLVIIVWALYLAGVVAVREEPAGSENAGTPPIPRSAPDACPPGTRLLENDRPDGRRSQVCVERDGKQHGWSISWYKNGEKREECEAVHGKLRGRCAGFYPDGVKEYAGEYKEDLRHGSWTFWFENGNKESEGEYREGERHGPWRFWFPNGRLRASGTFEMGVRKADWKDWKEDDKPAEEEQPPSFDPKTKKALDSAITRMKSMRQMPEVLAEPAVLVGEPFVSKSLLLSDPGIGIITQIASMSCDGNEGVELVVVGECGAAFVGVDRSAVYTVAFESCGRRMEAVDADGDGLCEFMDKGSVFGPVRLLDPQGRIRWSYDTGPEPRTMSAGDVDGDGALDFVVGLGGDGGIRVLNAEGNEKRRIPAFHISQLWVFDTDGDGAMEIVYVNRNGRLNVTNYEGGNLGRKSIGAVASYGSVCNWHSKSRSRNLLFIEETSAVLMDYAGHRLESFDAPLAFGEWVGGVVGTVVRLGDGGPGHLVAAVELPRRWRRSLLYMMEPDGGDVLVEIVPERIMALAAVPSGRTGEDVFLTGGDGNVWAYRFDTQKYSAMRLMSIGTPEGGDPGGGAFPVSVDNVAEEVCDGWWDWTVFLEAPEDELARISCVQYRLHPTFPDPVRLVCDRGKGPRAFPLSSSGWGTFLIEVRIYLKDGEVLETTHRLQFGGP